MRRLVATALAAVLTLSLFSAGPVLGHEIWVGGNCSTAVGYFYGNSNWQPWQHRMKACYGLNIPRLSAYTDSDGGNCAGFLGIDNGDWDECISSVEVTFLAVPAGVKFCMYQADNYGGNAVAFVGSWAGNLSAGFNDNISSFRWATSC